jgi:monofunctional chorismate mutase
MSIVAIRGAITIDKNDSNSILDGTKELIYEVEKRNNIDKNKVISIIFSSTKDLDAEYPAKAARELGYTNCALMCFNEMHVVNSLNKCIRVLILCENENQQDNIKHVYLKNAKVLRPDLVE